jgi:hypothetical protein
VDSLYTTTATNSVQVGSNGRLLKFTSANAVRQFLPSGATAGPLPAATIMVDPTTGTYQNSLAGEALALWLNILIDQQYPNMSPNVYPLDQLIVASGVCSGSTVAQMMQEANNILGGMPSIYSAGQFKNELSFININYQSGQNFGYLACPCVEFSRIAHNPSNQTPEDPTKPEIPATSKTVVAGDMYSNSPLATGLVEFKGYPNPFFGKTKLEFTIDHDSPVLLQVYNVNGKLIETIYEGRAKANEKYNFIFNAENLKAGMYFCRLRTDNGSYTQKLLLTQ